MNLPNGMPFSINRCWLLGRNRFFMIAEIFFTEMLANVKNSADICAIKMIL